MNGHVATGLLAAIGVLGGQARGDEPAAQSPQRYAVSINGESFTVDLGKPAQVESSKHPGTKYQLAVRLAEFQRWKLNDVQFEYQLGIQLTDGHQLRGRTATLRHPLGFVAVITDLGGTLPADAKSGALEQLVDGMKKTLRESGIEEVKISKPQRRKLGTNAVEAVTFSYLDSDGDERMSAVYLVTGEKFACSCLLQCEEKTREEAVAMVKAMLASIEPL